MNKIYKNKNQLKILKLIINIMIIILMTSPLISKKMFNK